MPNPVRLTSGLVGAASAVLFLSGACGSETITGGAAAPDVASPPPTEAGPGPSDAGPGPDARDVGPSADAGCVAPVGACSTYSCVKNVYWGDLHTHTSYSIDSYTVANRNDPKDAYAFAKGARLPIRSGSGGAQTVAIDRPLDFLAVTDHAEFLMLAGQCLLGSGGGALACRAFLNQDSAAQAAIAAEAALQSARPNPGTLLHCVGAQNAAECAAGSKSAWKKIQEAAIAANAQCSFTSLFGYEWTANTLSSNLHRNVIFGTDKVPDTVFDYLRYPTMLEVWRALEAGCKQADGCDAITIPHNSNYSYGTMWDTADDPAARPYMELYHTLAEIFQQKGNSECVRGNALSDPKCRFEESTGSLVGSLLGMGGGAASLDRAAPGMVRNGLARGLALEATTGKNPLVLGFVGATDTHNGTPGAVKEETWVGHASNQDDTPVRRLKDSEFNPGGITGVWAHENTRAEIFAALKRRETYATSGPRIVVRFFALQGNQSDADATALCADSMFPARLVAAGAKPMGAELPASGGPLRLFVAAMKDDVALGSIDVVKLVADAAGNVTQAVQSLPLPAGQSTACVHWRDTAVVLAQPALYYARVFQEPTHRWSHYACQAAGVDAPAGCAPDGGLDVKVQERAWTSPIRLVP